MTLVTTRFVVCHKLLFDVQQSLRTNLSWYMWWMKSGTQMPLLQSLCWERCSVLQGHNYLLESDYVITINRDIWAVFGSGRDIHISTALYCAYAEKAHKHLWCKGVRARHVCSHWYIFVHSLLETAGCKGCWGIFTHQIAPYDRSHPRYMGRSCYDGWGVWRQLMQPSRRRNVVTQIVP